jgi:DNA (cytosine-5)-methyltransferase 1
VIEVEQFKEWLKNNTSYSDAVICDTVSRIKRADGILEWSDDEVYQFYLEHDDNYKALSTSVRSQLKKAVTLYRTYHTSLCEAKNG